MFRSAVLLTALAVAPMPATGQPVTPRPVVDLAPDSGGAICGSMPENAVPMAGGLVLTARPSSGSGTRVFFTDGSSSGSHPLLAGRASPQYTVGSGSSGRIHVNVPAPIGGSTLRRSVVGVDADGRDEILFASRFRPLWAAELAGFHLFELSDPAALWWSDGTPQGVVDLGLGWDGTAALVAAEVDYAVVRLGATSSGQSLTAIGPGRVPHFVASTSGSVRSYVPGDGTMDLAVQNESGFGFYRVVMDSGEISSALSTAADCSSVSELVRVSDQQVLFEGRCGDAEVLGLYLAEEGEVTLQREAHLPDTGGIGVPIPTFPVRFRSPGDRLLISITEEDASDELFTWNTIEGRLEPAVELDHETLALEIDTGAIRLYAGPLHGRSGIWSLREGGGLVEIAEPFDGPIFATAVRDRVVFYHDDGVHGRELWMTDGTASGTRLVADLEPGRAGLQTVLDNPDCVAKVGSNDVSHLPVLRPTVLGDELFFSGYRADVGVEVFAVPLDLFEDEEAPEPDAPCEAAEVMCLGNGRFEIRVDWTTSTDSGPGVVASPATEDTGLFWFFRPDNWELMVKVLDACETNGYYWVLVGGTTDVGYELVIRDAESGLEWTTSNPLGNRSPSVIDVTAFACQIDAGE